jgi:hypothetical protein
MRSTEIKCKLEREDLEIRYGNGLSISRLSISTIDDIMI